MRRRAFLAALGAALAAPSLLLSELSSSPVRRIAEAVENGQFRVFRSKLTGKWDLQFIDDQKFEQMKNDMQDHVEAFTYNGNGGWDD